MFVIKVVYPENGYETFEAVRYHVNTDYKAEDAKYEDRMQKITFYQDDGMVLGFVFPYYKPDTQIYVMNEQGKTIDSIK